MRSGRSAGRRTHKQGYKQPKRRARFLCLEPLEARALLSVVTSPESAIGGEGEGATPATVQYTAQVFEPGGSEPLSAILEGREFDLQVLTQDLRSEGNPNRGVFAAFTDILFDQSLATVCVNQVQTLTIATPNTGSFTLTLNPGQTTSSINYDISTSNGRTLTAKRIENALNNLLGAHTALVASVGSAPANFIVRLLGPCNVAEPILQANIPNVTAVETVPRDPTNETAYLEAFRSRGIGLEGGSPGPYQTGFFATSASDRINELGGVNVGVYGTLPQEVAHVRMKATLPAGQAVGNLVLQPDVSAMDDEDQTLVYADISTTPPERSTVSPSAIAVFGAVLEIRRALVVQPASATIDEDTTGGVTIPVLPSATKDPLAPAGAVELRSFTQPSAGGVVTRFDPNQTPADRSDDQLRFVPNPNFNGTVTFSYTAGIVGDTIPEDSATRTVTVVVRPVNDAPTSVAPVSQTVNEDTNLVFSAANGNSISVADVDNDPAGMRVKLGATNGLLTLARTAGLVFLSGDGTDDASLTFTGSVATINDALNGLRYRPLQDFNGAGKLTIGTSDFDWPLNLPPMVLNGVAIDVTALNDRPVISVPAAQTVFTLNKLVFSPAFGNAITVTDVDAGVDPLSLTIDATGAINTVFAAPAPGVQVIVNSPTNLTIVGSQAAITATLSGLALTPVQSQQNATGLIAISVTDQGHNPGQPQISNATISVEVKVPKGPFGVNDEAFDFVEGNAAYLINVLGNDLVNSGSLARIVSFTQPAVGSVELEVNAPGDPSDDRLIYHPPLKNGQPDPDFFTPASLPPLTFTYVMNEQSGAGLPDSPPATVSIRIANAPDAPMANDDGLTTSGVFYTTTIGVPLVKGPPQGLLANDTVVDNAYGDPNVAVLSVLGGGTTAIQTAHQGTVTIGSDGSFTYSPALTFVGDDTFTYRAHSNLGGDSNLATVTIHVSQPPKAENDAFLTAQEDQTFPSPISVLANDEDLADHETLSAELVNNVPDSAGSVSLNANGFFMFTPAKDFNTTRPTALPITFTYRVTTPSGRQSAADRLGTVSITVNESNDDPKAVDDSYLAVTRQGSLGIDQVIDVLANDSIAPDGLETLTILAVDGVATGSQTGNPLPVSGGGSVVWDNQQIKYTSPTTSGGDAAFTYTISDGRGGTATATVQIHILPVYDYGDAPASYGTRFISDGARHIAVGPTLGALRDEEGDGVPSVSAAGDDSAGSDDEDGLSSSFLLRDKTSSITVQVANAAPSAKLDAWIDFNQSGTFEASEKISDSLVVANGPTTISFVTPAAAAPGPTVVRLRLSTAGGLGPTQIASDGEVEDHLVVVNQDWELSLPTPSGATRVAIRKHGANIELVESESGTVVATSPLAYTNSLTLRGSDAQAEEIAIDYQYTLAGAPVSEFFALPAGITLDGGASGGDSLVLHGDAALAMSARYSAVGSSLGNAVLDVSLGGVTSNIRFTNFEPLTIRDVAAVELAGTVNIGADVLTVENSSPAAALKLNSLTTIAGGAIHAPGGLVLSAAAVLRGSGSIDGRFSGEAGSKIEATGELSVGDALSSVGFFTAGELHTGSNAVKLLDADQVQLGSLTTLGVDGTRGTLIAASGLLLDVNEKITGLGTIQTPNDSAHLLINNGAILGNSADQQITLTGYVKGLGTLDQVTVTGTLSPGASPAVVNYGSVKLTATAKLIIEIGGTTAGSAYDEIHFTGSVVLGGTLEIIFLNSFEPEFDDSFTFVSAAGGTSGSFATLTLPEVGEALPIGINDRKWTVPVGQGDVHIDVVTSRPWHNRLKPYDVTGEGDIFPIDAQEVVNYINKFRSGVVPANAKIGKPFYDVTGDNKVFPIDAVEVINYLNARRRGKDEGEQGQAGALTNLADLIALLAVDTASAMSKRRRAE